MPRLKIWFAYFILVLISFPTIIIGICTNDAFAEKSINGLTAYDVGFTKGYFSGISEGLDNPPPFPPLSNQTEDYKVGYAQAWFLGCIDHQVGLSIADILSCSRVYEHYRLNTNNNFHEFIQHSYAVGYRDGFGSPPTQYRDDFTKNFNAYDSIEYKQGRTDGNKDGQKWYNNYSGIP